MAIKISVAVATGQNQNLWKQCLQVLRNASTLAISCILDRADDIVEEAYGTTVLGCRGRAWRFPSQSQMVCRELSPTFCGSKVVPSFFQCFEKLFGNKFGRGSHALFVSYMLAPLVSPSACSKDLALLQRQD